MILRILPTDHSQRIPSCSNYLWISALKNKLWWTSTRIWPWYLFGMYVLALIFLETSVPFSFHSSFFYTLGCVIFWGKNYYCVWCEMKRNGVGSFFLRKRFLWGGERSQKHKWMAVNLKVPGPLPPQPSRARGSLVCSSTDGYGW